MVGVVGRLLLLLMLIRVPRGTLGARRQHGVGRRVGRQPGWMGGKAAGVGGVDSSRVGDDRGMHLGTGRLVPAWSCRHAP